MTKVQLLSVTVVALVLFLVSDLDFQAQEPEPARDMQRLGDPTDLAGRRSLPLREHPWFNSTTSPQTALTGVDLDVTYINRAPMYKSYCVGYADGIPYVCPGTENEKRWPDPGEVVTFTAHIVNKGTATSPAFAYQWLIDGVEVGSGTHPGLAPGAAGTAAYSWAWAHTMDGERVLNDHTVRFTLDPEDEISETYEANNSLEDRTNALGLHLAITPAMYQAYNTPLNPAFSYSAEDWLQRQITAMNWSLANSTYGTTPAGATERVRINWITVTTTRLPDDRSSDGEWFVDRDYRVVSGGYDPVTDVDWNLVHELSHQVGLIDLYNLNIAATSVQVLDREGFPVNFGFGWPRPGLMVGGDITPHTDRHLYSEHSAAGISSTKGYRRGYFGEYQYDIPERNYLLVLDSQGNPAADVNVALYQRTGPPNGMGDLDLDATPEIRGTTGADGRLLLTNRSAQGGTTTRTGHILRDNPFGVVDVVGRKNRFLLQLGKADHQEFAWMDVTAFNLAYWGGHTSSHTFTISSHVPSLGAPERPGRVSAQVEGSQTTLCWNASPSTGGSGYYVYRAAPPIYTYERVGGLLTDFCYTDTYSGGNCVYAVTAVDDSGRESGFSSFLFAPRLINPYAVGVLSDGTRVVLDPQNGLDLLRQQSDGRFVQNLGSHHYHLEFSRFVAVDAEDRLIFSHPGDYYASRHSVRVADRDARPLFEFGERGSGPGQFETPAGVAVWGERPSAKAVSDEPRISAVPRVGDSDTALYRILVADSGNHRIQAFDEQGIFVSQFGGFGSGPGQFNDPQGLAVTGDDRVVVADTGNDRLQVLSFDGTDFAFVDSITADFDGPTGVAAQGNDRIVVADTEHNLVKVLDAEGTLLAEYDAPNDGHMGTFNRPRGVTVEESGDIVVADTGNRRVVTLVTRVRYVARSGADVGDCSTPAGACRTIQYAVDRAGEGNEIRVAAGTYTDVNARPPHDITTTGLVTQVVYLSKTVTIQGGYTTTNWLESNPDANPTTLSARRRGRVFYITGEISPTIGNLRITGGDAAGQGGWGQEWDAGGGVYVISATATLSNNLVFDNAARGGGGVFFQQGTATLKNNVIFSNTASWSCGGVYLSRSSATVNGNRIENNKATEFDGGGLCLAHGSATLLGNIVSANSANKGGGLYISNSDASLSGNTLNGNSAVDRGGGLHLQQSVAKLNGDTISGNTAAGYWGSSGGGLCLAYSDATLTNALVVGNQANVSGGGLHISASSARLLHATIVGNVGGDRSGLNITTDGSNHSTVLLTNTVLVSHSVGISITTGSSVSLESTLWYANATNWQGVATHSNDYSGDPAFVAPLAGDYHIGPGSAAINAGVDAGVTVDIDGQPRPFGTVPDLGADEFSANRAPDTPHDPIPADAVNDVPLNQVLEWHGGDPDGDPITYTIAFGTDDPPPLVTTGVTITTYDPGPLAASAAYYWAITATDGISLAVSPTWRFTTAASGLPFTGLIRKTVIPTHTVKYGDELTYTLFISAAPGTEITLFDPLSGTTFVRFAQQPAGVIHSDGVITGMLVVTPTNQVSVTFVTRVGVPGTDGALADVSNRACIIPFGGTLGGCIWSHEVTNSSYRPHTLYLPIVLRRG